jgi:hypothetical protein
MKNATAAMTATRATTTRMPVILEDSVSGGLIWITARPASWPGGPLPR